MTASTSLFSKRQTRSLELPWHRCASWSCRLGMALLWLTVVFLLARRVSGVLTAPDVGWMLWLAAAAAAAWAGGLRWLFHTQALGQAKQYLPGASKGSIRQFAAPSPGGCAAPLSHEWRGYSDKHLQWWNVALTAAMITGGVAISLPGASVGALAGLWLIVAISEAAGWRLRPSTIPLRDRNPASSARRGRSLPPNGGPSGQRQPISAPLDSDPSSIADLLATEEQRLVRGTNAAGAECVQGWVSAAFLPGQKTAAVHVAFCPPLAAAPGMELRQLSGPAARLRTAQALAYGARLEVKLAAPAEKTEIVRVAFRTTDAATSRPGVPR